RAAYWSGEKISLPISVARGAGPALAGARLSWRLDEARGEFALENLAPGQVTSAGKVRLPVPEVDRPAMARLELELTAASGERLAANHMILSFFPRPAAPLQTPIWAGDPRLAKWLTALGYELAGELGEAQAIVSRHLTADQLAAVRAGARLLLLAETPADLKPGRLNLHLTARKDGVWDGDWASSFAWIRREGPWASLPGGPLLDFSFDRVIPKLVIQGLTPEDFERRVPAGLFVGWVHKPVGLIALRPYGLGRVVVNTFRLLRDAPGADPVATTLLSALVQTTLGV
ncbi:MAG: glycoside hydrolase family 2, partial [Anaerolineales bacterium]